MSIEFGSSFAAEFSRKKRASERGPQGNKEDSMGFEETGN